MAVTPSSQFRKRKSALALPLDTNRRMGVAAACGVVAALLVWTGHAAPETRSDWDYTFVTARAVVKGQDPYMAVERAIEKGSLPRPYYYPATAPVFASPFGLLPHRLSITLYAGIGVTLLA